MEVDRLDAIVNLKTYQRETRQWRDRKVIPRAYKVGELVLQRSPRTKSKGKLEPKWEGPYIVARIDRPGPYKLQTSQEEELQHSWNADNLCKFYI